MMEWTEFLKIAPDVFPGYSDEDISIQLLPTEGLMDLIMSLPVLDTLDFDDEPDICLWITPRDGDALTIQLTATINNNGTGEFWEIDVDPAEIRGVLDEQCREAFGMDLDGIVKDWMEWLGE